MIETMAEATTGPDAAHARTGGPFEASLGTLQAHIIRASDLNNRLRAVKARILGIGPEDTGAETPRPVPDGLVGILQTRNVDLAETLDVTDALVSALEEI